MLTTSMSPRESIAFKFTPNLLDVKNYYFLIEQKYIYNHLKNRSFHWDKPIRTLIFMKSNSENSGKFEFQYRI